MIYKIDHYYNRGRNECRYAILVESEFEPEKLANIVGAIQLKFETIQDNEDNIDDRHLLHLLKSYYGVKDVKAQYQHVLNRTVLEDGDWERIVHIPIIDGEHKYMIIQIDLYEAREYLCGEHYQDSFKHLPNSEEFALELSDLSNFYLRSL